MSDRLLWRCGEQFGVEVVALLLFWLVFFDPDLVGVGVGVLPDAGHLPGHFHIRLAGANAPARTFPVTEQIRQVRNTGNL